MKPDATEIKRRIDMRRFVSDDIGAAEAGNGYLMCRCPFHSGGNERTPSFMVKEDHAHCYSERCGWHGDVIKYVMDRTGRDFKNALEFLSGDSRIQDYKPSQQMKLQERFVLTMEDVERYQTELFRVKPYLESRNIPITIMERNRIGGTEFKKVYIDTDGKEHIFKCNRVVLPYVLNDKVYSQNYRRDDLSCDLNAKTYQFMQKDLGRKWGCDPNDVTREQVLFHAFGARFFKPKGTKSTIYGLDQLLRQTDRGLFYKRLPYVLVTEGEFNQLSGISLGFPTVAMKAYTSIDVVRLLQNVVIPIIAVDKDDAGFKYAEKMLTTLGRGKLMMMPDGFNDMNDLHKQGLLESFLSSRPYCLEKST